MARIFISYRRSDSAIWAGRIRDHLVEHFGRSSIFIDVEDIPGGRRFTEAIAQTIATAQAMIVVIGPNWVSSRLVQKDDPVGNEIEMAFRSNVKVIPVLIDSAQMPTSASLPPAIAKLAEINAIEIRANHFTKDMEQLVQLFPKSRKRLAVFLALLFMMISVFVYFIVVRLPRTSSTGPSESKQENTQASEPEIVKVAVPQLLKKSPEAAALEAEAAGLKISLAKRKVGKLEDAGIVVDQSPLAGVQLARGQEITAFVGAAELEIDFRNSPEGAKGGRFTERGITFKIAGNTQSCGEAVLEIKNHKLLGSYLGPSSTGDLGLSCAQLPIEVTFSLPVAEVSVLTHPELGNMELSAFDKDGNRIGSRRLSPEVSGDNTKRLTIASPDGKPGIYRASFHGTDESLIYSLRVKR